MFESFPVSCGSDVYRGNRTILRDLALPRSADSWVTDFPKFAGQALVICQFRWTIGAVLSCSLYKWLIHLIDQDEGVVYLCSLGCLGTIAGNRVTHTEPRYCWMTHKIYSMNHGRLEWSCTEIKIKSPVNV